MHFGWLILSLFWIKFGRNEFLDELCIGVPSAQLFQVRVRLIFVATVRLWKIFRSILLLPKRGWYFTLGTLEFPKNISISYVSPLLEIWLSIRILSFFSHEIRFSITYSLSSIHYTSIIIWFQKIFKSSNFHYLPYQDFLSTSSSKFIYASSLIILS